MKKILLSVFVIANAGFGFSQAACSDLFFSEYIEGTSSNKAIEIYNPTSNLVDLSNYHIYRYVNGSTTPGDTLMMDGILAPGEVYTAVNPSADSLNLQIYADTLHTITFYNGDDALELYNNNTLIDVIGEKGVDPGTNWPVDSGATSEFTLVRKFNVFAGTTNWAIGATQWDVYPQNDFTHFDVHSMAPCSTAAVTNEMVFEINLYPNPTSGHLNIVSESNNYSLQVFDLTGKMIINRINLSQNTNINLSDLTNGIYMVKLNNGSTQLTKKIIVSK